MIEQRIGGSSLLSVNFIAELATMLQQSFVQRLPAWHRHLLTGMHGTTIHFAPYVAANGRLVVAHMRSCAFSAIPTCTCTWSMRGSRPLSQTKGSPADSVVRLRAAHLM
jgi:hypothetical protein